MIEIKAPNMAPTDERLRIFLAGSIEQGLAEPWQAKVVETLKDLDVVFLNPRREIWDPNLDNKASNPVFAEQVNWEMDAIGSADLVLFYFDPNTKSPVTLLELGFLLGENERAFAVCCPEGYWRRGNVEIMLKRAGQPLFSDWNDWLKIVRRAIELSLRLTEY